jgi:hypothetical protein
MKVREHQGWGHGLNPGTDHDINCISCRKETGQEPVITGSEQLARETLDFIARSNPEPEPF